MNFHRYGHSFIDCTKIGNDSKRIKTSRNEVMQSSTIRDQLFLNHVHNQARFGKPVIKAGGFINLGILKMVFTF